MKRYSRKRVVNGMAHITGGGLKENIARVLAPDCDAIIRRTAWKPPPIFEFLRKLGTTRSEMFKVFNMGIGYVFIVRPFFATAVMKTLRSAGEKPLRIGRIARGRQCVQIR